MNVGDWVLIRNFNKRSKLDPLFQPKPCMVIEVENGWVVLERDVSIYRRHLDDVKPVHYQPPQQNDTNIATDTQWQWEIPNKMRRILADSCFLTKFQRQSLLMKLLNC